MGGMSPERFPVNMASRLRERFGQISIHQAEPQRVNMNDPNEEVVKLGRISSS